jgi:DNA-binding MarR family transcriptional regulator
MKETDLDKQGATASRPGQEPMFFSAEGGADVGALADVARAILSFHRYRDSIFADRNLFGEPSWNILLDLFEARARGNSVSVTSACVGSGVPATTALRYISALVESGWVVRHPHPWDNRVSLLTLSDDATEKMTALLRTVKVSFTQA